MSLPYIDDLLAENSKLKGQLEEAVGALDWLYRNASAKYPVRDLDESIEHARILLAKLKEAGS